MIARMWHGAVPIEKSEEYLKHMRGHAIDGYRKIAGNQGAWVFHRTEDKIAHFDMLTFWDDIEAVKRFAGEDYETPVYYEYDDDMLIEKEDHVRHWDMYSE